MTTGIPGDDLLGDLVLGGEGYTGSPPIVTRGRAGLRSGGFLRLSEAIGVRSGVVRVSGGGNIRIISVQARDEFILRRPSGGSALGSGAALRRQIQELTARGIIRVSSDGDIRVSGSAHVRGVHRVSGGGDIRVTGGTRSTVPATSVGSWRS